MSIHKMSNYKSTIKSTTASSSSATAAKTVTRATNKAAFMKFLLINLLIFVQTLTFCEATATTTASEAKPQHHNVNPLSMLTAATNVASLSSHLNDGSVADSHDKAASAEISLNGATAADVDNAGDDGDDNAYVGVDSDNLAINQIISNLTLLHDAAHEYDATTVSLLGNVTHYCLQTCMDEVSNVRCTRNYFRQILHFLNN